MALKLPRYFYLLMEKPLGGYFQLWSPYYQAAQCNQKTNIPVSSRWQVRSEKAKKITINTSHSYHQRSSPYASLNWSKSKARFSFNQPNRKIDTVDWGKKWLVDFNTGKTQLVLFDRSNNNGYIDVKMNGSILEEKSSFKMLGWPSLLNWIGVLTLSLLLKLPPSKLEL